MTATPIPPLPGTDDSERGPSLLREQPTRPGLPPRRLTLASFDNLVVLANYDEHLREARRMVWRDRGEPAIDIHDIHECLVHGARGALRVYLSSPLLPSTEISSYRCWYNCLCYPFWRKFGLTFGTYQELVQVRLYLVFRR